MKKILLLLCFCGSGWLPTQAQYHPLLSDTTKWCVHWNFLAVRSTERFMDYNRIEAMGDTTIATMAYKKAWTDVGGYYGALREDTTAQQVFLVRSGDSTEQLLYDFSLNLGDTLVIDLQNNSGGNMYDGNYIVDSVTIVNIRGGLRKYLRLHNPLNTTTGPNGKHMDLEWIESVGDLHNTFYLYMYDGFGYGPSGFACGTEQESEILNNEQNGVRNYVNMCVAANAGGTLHSDTCTIDYWGSVHDIDHLSVKTTVYPNPSDAQNLKLDVNGFTGQALTLVVSDMSGQTVWTGTRQVNAQTVVLGNLSLGNGLYLLHVYDQGQKIAQTRFAVAK